MNTPRKRQLLLILITLVAIGSTVLVGAAKSLGGARVAEAWVGTWAAAAAPAPPAGGFTDPLSSDGFDDQTVRTTVHTSVGGRMARLRLTNRYGTGELMIGHATIALPWPDAGPGDVHPDSIHELTFNGRTSVAVPRGGAAVSDPVTMDVPASQDVAISLYLPERTGPPTLHQFSRTTSYVGPGDNAAAPSGAKMSKNIRSWYYINGLDVLNRSGQGAIVVLGDSITDGVTSAPNANHRWTNHLATRLNKARDDNAPGVLNVGIAGNRLGLDGSDFKSPHFGVNASARFAHDVVSQTGVRAVIVQLGINDIWISKDDPDEIISDMQQLASLAHQVGLKIFVCTLTPWDALVFNEVPQYTPALDTIRLTVNSYLRTTSDFDGIIDFDLALRDPGQPTKLRPEWDSGDHIHPNDAGYEAMANAVPLDLLLEL